MSYSHLALLLVVGALGSACTTQQGNEASKADFTRQQQQAARSLQADERLAEALAMWRSMLPLNPGDVETTEAINTLDQEISQRVAALLRRGKQAYARGSTRQGDTDMLKVLALQPGQAQALERLGKSQSAHARAQQKNTRPQPGRVSPSATAATAVNVQEQLRSLYQQRAFDAMVALGKSIAAPAAPAVSSLLRLAHIGLADQAESAGQVDTELDHIQQAMALEPVADDPLISRSLAIRKEQSLHWYEQGSHMINSDLPGAIAALQKSLSYNPYNSDARRKLLQAETLQRNLQKIEGGG